MIELEESVERVVRAALRSPDVEADVLAVEADSLDVGVRLGRAEKLKRSRERRLGLRVFVGHSSAIVSTADLVPTALDALVQHGIDLARSTASDPFSGLPELEPNGANELDLDLFDASVSAVTVEESLALAMSAENAALELDPRLTNSEGAEFASFARRTIYASSRGFSGTHRGSSFSLSVAPVAQSNGSMQRDYWYTSARHRVDLEEAGAVGRKAAKRTLRRIGARPVRTRQAPVIFDPEMAATLLGHLIAAVAGSSIYRGLSFLRDKLGAKIFPDTIRITDDPLRRRGSSSRRFDAEGIASRENVVVADGVLATFLLDTYSARKLGAHSTANAVRSLGEPPTAGATNFYMAAGRESPEALIRSVNDGFYVTELIGSSINPVTGDYSRGAAGMWIEGGELAYAVEGVTIAGNLLEMYSRIEAIGNDLVFRSSISAPTVKIGQMTIAGEG